MFTFSHWVNSKARVKAISTFCAEVLTGNGSDSVTSWLMEMPYPACLLPFRTLLLLSMNQSSASSTGTSFKSRQLEDVAPMVSKQSWCTGSPVFPLRKEAGLTMLVITISTSSCSTSMDWYFRNLCGESHYLPFISNTADTVWDTNTVIFLSQSEFSGFLDIYHYCCYHIQASWLSFCGHIQLLGDVGDCSVISKSKSCANTPRAIPCFS